MNTSKKLTLNQKQKFLQTLEERFNKNMQRHKNTKWADVLAKLEKEDSKLWSLNEMEDSGGEPDVVDISNNKNEFVFIDCSPESPSGRRSLCYDEAALKSRKKHKPNGSAVGMSGSMGTELLTEDEYRTLQTFGEFDTKTSTWVETPTKIRELGGAVFCDRRYNTVFLYHNGAESYYASRGFRAKLIL